MQRARERSGNYHSLCCFLVTDRYLRRAGQQSASAKIVEDVQMLLAENHGNVNLQLEKNLAVALEEESLKDLQIYYGLSLTGLKAAF